VGRVGQNRQKRLAAEVSADAWLGHIRCRRRLGPNTDEFTLGDEIFGATNPFFIYGYAEYAIANARMIARRPASLSHLEAAALPVVGVTAWQMLFDHGQAREGQTVVVHGS
jgi:NADPH:quinone reductase-like Zn-dependent oxidoreductase